MRTLNRRQLLSASALAGVIPSINESLLAFPTGGSDRNPNSSSGSRFSPLLCNYVLDQLGQKIGKASRKTILPEDLMEAGQYSKIIAHHCANTGIDNVIRQTSKQIDPASIDFSNPQGLDNVVAFLKKYHPGISRTEFIPGNKPTADQIAEITAHVQTRGLSGYFFRAADVMKKTAQARASAGALGMWRDSQKQRGHYAPAIYQPAINLPHIENTSGGICSLLPKDFCQNIDAWLDDETYLAAILAVICLAVSAGFAPETLGLSLLLEAFCGGAAMPLNATLLAVMMAAITWLKNHCCAKTA